MKTAAAILILIANLWSLTSNTSLLSVFDSEETGGITTQQDPPEDGGVIILPPPRQ